MPELYALLVGIDAYAPALRALEGCVHDATAMQDLLTRRYQAKCATLLNGQATRQAIIDGFRTHLAQAKAGDSAVFFFAGHGSQVPTGGLFAKIEQTKKLQSIVCSDSRPDGFDLVDKDIAVLISELTSHGVHVTLIMDSCHSGSISRDSSDRASAVPLVRVAPDRGERHPAEAFVNARGVSDAEALNMTLATVEGFLPDISGRHILLAACESTQSSQELPGQAHGLFTASLLQVLDSSDEGLAYDEVYQRVRSLQQQKIAAVPKLETQNPRLESLAGDANRMGLFLRMSPAFRTEFFLARFLSGQWTLDGGVLNRLSPGDTLAVYPDSTATRELRDLGKAIGQVTVRSANPADSILDANALALDPAQQYKAAVVERAARLGVALEGEPSGIALLSDALQSAPSVRPGAPARFTARCEGGQIFLSADSGRKAPGPFPATQEGAAEAAGALEHMALWTLRLELANPVSKITAQQVQFAIIDKDGREFDCPPLASLELRSVCDASGAWQPATFSARITNLTQTPFSVALLAFAEDWSIFTGLLAGGTEVLPPSLPGAQPSSIYALSGQPIEMTIDSSRNESHDELVLLVSSDDFSASSLALEPYAPLAETRGYAAAQAIPVSPWQHDFVTRRLSIHSVRVKA